MPIGKNALVTGSTHGIGAAVAAALAEDGMNVMLTGPGDRVAVETIRAGLADRCGVTVGYHGGDLAGPADVVALVARTHAALGPIDVLVNVTDAGLRHVAPIEELPIARWDAVLAGALSSAFHAIRLTVAGMKTRRWGRIINVASVRGLVAAPRLAAAVAAEHGLLGLTRTVALETAAHGVTVNAICPGVVLTARVERQIPATATARGLPEDTVVRDILLGAQPTRRFVATEQLGALARFLCTDAASAITGAALPVDGAWIAQ